MKTINPSQIDFDFLRLGGRTEELAAGARDGRLGGADEAREAAREFESFLLYYLIKTMRETVQESELFGNRRSEQVYRSMMDEEVANHLAERGGLGLQVAI
ncbi:MAG: rod-binding protein [bacterium]|nr:rod-binding protein [bacterium]